jgi:hypothetical protein
MTVKGHPVKRKARRSWEDKRDIKTERPSSIMATMYTGPAGSMYPHGMPLGKKAKLVRGSRRGRKR